MIIELKSKTRLISNRRNRMLLTLVSQVWTVTLQPYSDHKYRRYDRFSYSKGVHFCEFFLFSYSLEFRNYSLSQETTTKNKQFRETFLSNSYWLDKAFHGTMVPSLHGASPENSLQLLYPDPFNEIKHILIPLMK